MKTLFNLMIKMLALLGILAILNFSFSSHVESFSNTIDLKAAFLVFAMPLFLLVLFEKESLAWMQLFRRARETIILDQNSLRTFLSDNTSGVTGQYAVSNLLKIQSSSADSFVKYGAELMLAKFSQQEISSLLNQRIEAEDQQWYFVGSRLGFMAKMAPYFGMLATVIGMVKLLENMNDFSRISGSMALAMEGTLYGLISFTLIYSPLLKLLSSWRDQLRKRNEMIAQWYSLVSSRADVAYIQEDLRSTNLLTPLPDRASIATSPTSANARSAR